MSKMIISIPDKEHKIFKLFAVVNSITLSELVVSSVKERIARRLSKKAKKPNKETELAFHESENNMHLQLHEDIEKFIDDLGLEE